MIHPARLEQYLALAREQNQQLNINIEIDVGLHRGGLTDPQQLDAMIALIEAHPEQLRFSGFMGYDAHVGEIARFYPERRRGPPGKPKPSTSRYIRQACIN